MASSCAKASLFNANEGGGLVATVEIGRIPIDCL
jgi:hypothetical protein